MAFAEAIKPNSLSFNKKADFIAFDDDEIKPLDILSAISVLNKTK